MALALIEAAEADGRLKTGGSVAEYTGGSTGVTLSLVCAVKRYSLHVVTSDAFAREKLDHMRMFGASLQIVPSGSGRMTERLTSDMIEAARVVAADTGGFWTDQMNDGDQLAAYHDMVEETWLQTGGRIDGFVQAVGAAASLRASQKPYAAEMKRSKSSLRSPPNPRFCLAAEREHIRSMGTAPALSCRSGKERSRIGSNGFYGRSCGYDRSASLRGRRFRGNFDGRQCRRRFAIGRATGT